MCINPLYSMMLMSLSYQGRITNQLHRLGGSYDWDRVAFTMDEVRLACNFLTSSHIALET